MNLLISAENKHLWETCIHRTAAVKMVGLPSGSLSPDTIAPTKGDVKYSCIYLATSASEVCAFSVLMHMNSLVFFLTEKRFFALTESHQQKYHHRGNQFEIPLAGRRFDKVREKENATVQETSHHGHRASSRLGLFQAYLDSAFW